MIGWAGLSVRDGLDLSGLDPTDLWWRYAALGGSLGHDALVRALQITPEALTPLEHDIAAVALNEAFADLGMPTYPVATVLGAPHQVVRMMSRALAERAFVAQQRSAQLRATSLRLHRQAARVLAEHPRVAH